MASILVPQKPAKKQDMTEQLLPVLGQVAGTAVGAYFGGPVGAAAGGAAGGALAGAASKNSSRMDQNFTPNELSGSDSAISRRLADIENNDDYSQLLKARQSLETAPKELKDQYKETLENALRISKEAKQQAAQRGPYA